MHYLSGSLLKTKSPRSGRQSYTLVEFRMEFLQHPLDQPPRLNAANLLDAKEKNGGRRRCRLRQYHVKIVIERDADPFLGASKIEDRRIGSRGQSGLVSANRVETPIPAPLSRTQRQPFIEKNPHHCEA
jgi:hypothetical protein